MAPRWNAWTHVQDVRFDYEKTSKPRQVRMSAASIIVGQPVRIGLSGVEIEGVIADIDGGVLMVKIKRTLAKVQSTKATQRDQKTAEKRRRRTG